MTDVNSTATSEPAPAPPAPAEPETYRPVSLLAIVGLIVAGLYVALVAGVAVLGLFQATPVFLPGWTLLLAITAAGLCLVAQWQIYEAEGTRAGQSLARWGLALSVFAGLGYGAYQYFTGLALVQQANEFLMSRDDVDSGFFPRLQAGTPTEINHAFLLTLPESNRIGIDPKDVNKLERLYNRSTGPKSPEGPLRRFRNNFLVHAITRYGQQAQIEPLGVDKWVFEQGGYVVWRSYRISLPEMVLDIVVPAHSTEGEQRKWFVAFQRIDFKHSELTALGKELLVASLSARAFAERSAARTPWKELQDATDWENVVSDRAWKPMRDQIASYFQPAGNSAHNLNIVPPKHPEREIPAWKVVNQHLRFTLDFKYTFKGKLDAPWMGNGTLVVENKKPVSLDANGVPVPQNLAGDHEWRVVSIKFQHLGNMEKMMKGQLPEPE